VRILGSRPWLTGQSLSYAKPFCACGGVCGDQFGDGDGATFTLRLAAVMLAI